MMNTDGANGWVGVARETFERGMVPWVGRKHESWLRAWARPHPVDPGQILVPGRVYRVYADRPVMQPISRWQLEAMGYPELPPAERADPAAPQGSPRAATDRATWSSRSLPSAA